VLVENGKKGESQKNEKESASATHLTIRVRNTVLILGLIFFCNALFSQEYKVLPISLGKQETDFILKSAGKLLTELPQRSTICMILSTSTDDLWHFTKSDGCNMAKAIEFMVPFVADKTAWPFPKDIVCWDE
jgi:hypothetical protein